MPAASEVVRKRRAPRDTARLSIRTPPSAVSAYGPGLRPDYTRTTHADRAWLHTPPARRAAPSLVVDLRSAGSCLPSYPAHQRSRRRLSRAAGPDPERSERVDSRPSGGATRHRLARDFGLS